MQRTVADAAAQSVRIKGFKAQSAAEASRLQSFQNQMADALMAGLLVMLSTALWHAFTYGLLDIRLGRWVMHLYIGVLKGSAIPVPLALV